MRLIKNNSAFLIFTVFLIAVIAFCIKGTVKGMDKSSYSYDESMEEYYRQCEKEYVAKVKEYLNANGFSNAGVMLTKVTDSDLTRHYTLTVNHHKLTNVSQIDSAVSDIDFPVDDAEIIIMTTNR